ncbi:hypothetical protein [Bradyrhizobium sp. CCBAU 45384]|nr:hypothetical protein [Bradyrhizobium sp. CCBAU 45384]
MQQAANTALKNFVISREDTGNESSENISNVLRLHRRLLTTDINEQQ